MTDLFNFVKDHTRDIIAILTGIVTVASLIANLTPSDSDNKLVAKMAKLVDFLALNIKK